MHLPRMQSWLLQRLLDFGQSAQWQTIHVHRGRIMWESWKAYSAVDLINIGGGVRRQSGWTAEGIISSQCASVSLSPPLSGWRERERFAGELWVGGQLWVTLILQGLTGRRDRLYREYVWILYTWCVPYMSLPLYRQSLTYGIKLFSRWQQKRWKFLCTWRFSVNVASSAVVLFR